MQQYSFINNKLKNVSKTDISNNIFFRSQYTDFYTQLAEICGLHLFYGKLKYW